VLSDHTYHSQTQHTAHDIMSLLLPSSWNQPILVAASGVAAAALLPVLARRQLPLSSLQLLQVASYALNVWATAQPGRLDGKMAVEVVAAAPPQQQQEDASRSKKNQGGKKADDDTKKEKKTSADIIDPAVAAITTGRHGRTLLIPKGWAFIIWVPIFMGELLHVATSCLLTSSSAAGTIQLLQRTAPGFVIAQLFQTLWAASFRPKYKGLTSFISFAMLSGIAISLIGPHAAIASAHAHDNNNFLNLQTYLLHGLPITLHFGWTTAASLVNLNGCYAMMADSSDKWLTVVGHASVVVATALGVAVTLSRQAPVYGGVICWALLACADGMADRLKSSSVPVVQKQQQQGGGQSSSPTPAVAPARVQQWLCWVGAGIVAVASIVATAARWSLIIAPGGIKTILKDHDR
jgi:hypothetical protein